MRPVVPVRVFGTFEAYGKEVPIPRPHKIMAKYGKPMNFDALRAEAKIVFQAAAQGNLPGNRGPDHGGDCEIAAVRGQGKFSVREASVV